MHAVYRRITLDIYLQKHTDTKCLFLVKNAQILKIWIFALKILLVCKNFSCENWKNGQNQKIEEMDKIEKKKKMDKIEIMDKNWKWTKIENGQFLQKRYKNNSWILKPTYFSTRIADLHQCVW